MYLGVILLVFILHGICCTSRICGLTVFIKSRKFLATIPPNIILCLFPISWDSYYICDELLKIVKLITESLLSLKTCFSWASACLASIALFSSLLIFYSVASNLLIPLCIVLFLIWYFFISRRFIRFFFISSIFTLIAFSCFPLHFEQTPCLLAIICYF